MRLFGEYAADFVLIVETMVELHKNLVVGKVH